MSMNLLLRNDSVPANQAEINWNAIKAASQNEFGMVTITDETVTSIARLLDGVLLTNGEKVSAYPMEEDDCMNSFIAAFGPALLPVQIQDQVRDRLAIGDNGKVAVRLFNEMIRLGLQVTLHGTEHCPAYIKGVNWIADDVEINRSSGNMTSMICVLGLADAMDDDDSCMGEVTFARFEAAVNDNGHCTDVKDRLQAFLACGRRRNATHVYWA